MASLCITNLHAASSCRIVRSAAVHGGSQPDDLIYRSTTTGFIIDRPYGAGREWLAYSVYDAGSHGQEASAGAGAGRTYGAAQGKERSGQRQPS
eukprot:796580-Pleurochrysis_carterae.AAC.1